MPPEILARYFMLECCCPEQLALAENVAMVFVATARSSVVFHSEGIEIETLCYYLTLDNFHAPSNILRGPANGTKENIHFFIIFHIYRILYSRSSITLSCICEMDKYKLTEHNF